MRGALSGKRVIVVLPSLELGGSERQALLLARWLRDREGAEVQVWGKGPSGRASDLCDEAKLPWRAVEMELRVGRWTLFWNLRRFAKLVREARADILLPYTTGPNVFCGATWRKAGAKACVWNQRDEGRRLGVQAIDAKAAHNTPVLVSNSQHAADVVKEALGVREVRVIHNGVELAPPLRDRADWRAQLKAGSGQFVATMVANVHGYKDHTTLIRAWRAVVDVLGSRAVLALAGKPGDKQAEVEALIVQFKLTGDVVLLGQVADVSGLLAASDIGVFSSHKEGCPNGVLECMAAGLAVAGTDIPGIREAVGDAGKPWLAPENDDHVLSERIIALAQDVDARKEAGEANRARIAAEFSPEKMCRETVQAIKDSMNHE
ncbi:MAG: glycosyltransferase [Planctomycetes bacterium]|nr:glycosyltransferase [Planctomycetota bacterium]